MLTDEEPSQEQRVDFLSKNIENHSEEPMSTDDTIINHEFSVGKIASLNNKTVEEDGKINLVNEQEVSNAILQMQQRHLLLQNEKQEEFELLGSLLESKLKKISDKTQKLQIKKDIMNILFNDIEM